MIIDTFHTPDTTIGGVLAGGCPSIHTGVAGAVVVMLCRWWQ